jgi:hypothetical protein
VATCRANRLSGRHSVRAAVQRAVTRRRPRLSPQARKRIAEAQRKRWAELKAKQAKRAADAQNAVTSKPQKRNGAPKKR